MEKIQDTIWKYYLFTFLKDLAFFGGVLVPFFTDWGHISLLQVQILQSWFWLWTFILEIPTGAVADYMGRKYSLALGAVFWVLAALLYGSVPRFEVFLVAEFLFAMGIALVSGANSALLYDSLKEIGQQRKSREIFGRAHSFKLGGMMIAAPIGSLMAARWGLNFPMLISAIPFFLAGCVTLTIREPKIKSDKESESMRYVDIVRQGFTYFYKHRILRLIALDAIVVSAAAYFVIWLYQPLLKSMGVAIVYFGIVHALFVGTEILVSSNFGLLIRLFKSDKALLQFSALVTGLSFIVVAAIPNLFTIVIFIIFAGGFGLTRLELMTAHMNSFIPSRKRATVLSSISMFRSLALVLLNPLVGFAADHSLRLALLLVGILPLTVFLFSPVEQGMLETD